MTIKKEVTTCKVALNTLMYRNNEDEEMSGTSGLTKNKDVPLHSDAATPTSNHVFANENGSDLDAERHAYESTLIASNYD